MSATVLIALYEARLAAIEAALAELRARVEALEGGRVPPPTRASTEVAALPEGPARRQ